MPERFRFERKRPGTVCTRGGEGCEQQSTIPCNEIRSQMVVRSLGARLHVCLGQQTVHSQTHGQPLLLRRVYATNATDRDGDEGKIAGVSQGEVMCVRMRASVKDGGTGYRSCVIVCVLELLCASVWVEQFAVSFARL